MSPFITEIAMRLAAVSCFSAWRNLGPGPYNAHDYDRHHMDITGIAHPMWLGAGDKGTCVQASLRLQ